MRDDGPIDTTPKFARTVLWSVFWLALVASLHVVLDQVTNLDQREIFAITESVAAAIGALGAMARGRNTGRVLAAVGDDAGPDAPDASTVFGWRMLALGGAVWTVARLWLTFGNDRFDPLTVAAIAGLAAMVWAVAMSLGVGHLGISRPQCDARTLTALQAAQVSVAIGYMVWMLAIAPELGALSDYGGFQLAIRAGVPVFGLCVLSMGVLVGLGQWSPTLLSLSLGALSITVGMTLVVREPAMLGSPITWAVHASWLIGLALIALSTRGRLRRTDDIGSMSSTARVLLTQLPIAASLVVSAWAFGTDSHEMDVVLQVLATVAAVLIVGVQVGLWRESDRLRRELQVKVEEIDNTHGALRLLLDNLPEAVVVLEASGRIRDCNAQAEALIGVSREEIVGRSMIEFVPDAERDRLLVIWNEMLAGDVESMDKPVFGMPHPDGHVEMVEANVALDAVRPDYVVVSMRDVSDRIRAEADVKRAQERFRAAFHSAPTGMALVLAETGELIEVNAGLAAMLRCPPEDLVGRGLSDITHPDDAATLAAELSGMGEVGGTRVLQRRYVRGDGTVMWGATSVSLMIDPSGEPMVIAHVLDITQQMVAAEQLSWSATHDPVTGLSNRSYFLERLDQVLAVHEGRDVAVLFLDLDRFKVVNDSLGHAVGDDLLRTVADRLTDSVRDDDLVARFGGDEFTVLLTDAPLQVASAVAERVREALATPVPLETTEIDVTASIGLAFAAGAEVTADDLVRDADAAMYRAKDQGRDRIEVFSPETHALALRVLHTGNELRHGLERGEIVPYFQPIVDLGSGRLSGYEVMARWLHPERGLLLPGEFLSVAEDRGLISDLGSSILRSALAQFAQWMARPGALGPLTLSVNVSARQLTDRNLVDNVAEALAEAGVDADSLWLEITESALMTDVRAATTALRDLRSLGLHLAVDDFGTGYSSLTYLKRFPVEAIKVDRSFVAGLGLDAEDSTIVEAVVRLGSSLGLVTVAEGVETPLQLARLREIDCQLAQGYLFGRPRPAEMLEPFIQLS